ncbi:MAG: hypothetical protein ABWY00_11590 [Dongiaceae bacterium]
MIPPHSYPSNRYANSSKSDLSATERRALASPSNEAPEPAHGPIEVAPTIPVTEADAAKTVTNHTTDHPAVEEHADKRPGNEPSSEPAIEHRKILKVKSARTAPAKGQP